MVFQLSGEKTVDNRQVFFFQSQVENCWDAKQKIESAFYLLIFIRAEF
jgi:hypothetical protein